MSRPDRLAMVDRGHAAVSVRRQCALLGVGRAGVYRSAPAPGPEDLALMRRLDALYLEAPFFGSRRMVEALRRDGVRVGRHRVRRLMRLMGLEALLQLGQKNIIVQSDSQLMVRQLNGEYRVKDEKLKALFDHAMRLLRQFDSYRILHVRREVNKLADRLANLGIDRAIKRTTAG